MKTLDSQLTALARDLCRNFQNVGSLAGTVRVLWNPRMRSAAGRAFWPGGTIELNPLLKDISEAEVSRTFRHELAHLLVFARYGTRRRPHGPEWQLFCAELGIPGERPTHRLELPRRSQRPRFRYRCDSCSWEMTRVRRLKRAGACPRCCRLHAGGKFDRRFLLVESPI